METTNKNQLEQLNDEDQLVGNCKQCGIEIRLIKGKKKKQFCSDRCRWDWWNNHIKETKHKAQSNN
jgi:endogenous inhibitor of DNA gyrase (YacG/DUF329 family)